MSIIDSFDGKSRAILNPEDIIPRPENFPKTVLASFQKGIVQELHNILQPEEFDSLDCVYRVPLYRFSYQGQELALYLSPLGGPASAGILEKIIAKGAERVLFFGTCGALDNARTDGKLVVPTAGKLCEIFDGLGVPYVRGKTWTTDAIYRETERNAEARRSEGCLTVEMECASVMAVGQFRQFPVYQFLYTADSLDGGAWERRTLGNTPKSDYEKHLRIALETAIRL